MNIHEYQAKTLLKQNKVEIQEGYIAKNCTEAVENAKKLQTERKCNIWVIKAQIHAGGRGKGGGVKLAKSLEEVRKISDEILGMTLITKQTGTEGKLVNKVLISEDVYFHGKSDIKEFYISILLDRKKEQHVIVYSTEGGMDIEEVAEKTPEKIYKIYIHPHLGLRPFQTQLLCDNLNLSGETAKNMKKFVFGLFQTYIKNDASLIEINPTLKTSNNRILAVDAKINLDDNAFIRHPDLKELKDLSEENPDEIEASSYGLNYVKMNGNVGCMVNGAGLAMATMDIIKHSGGDPANFLDVGGTANAQRVEKAFHIILKDKNVKTILVNIFGGIVRCDRVAQGIVDAYHNIGNIQIPIVIRLQGTNAQKAKKIIDNSNLKVESAILFAEAAEKVKSVLKN